MVLTRNVLTKGPESPMLILSTLLSVVSVVQTALSSTESFFPDASRYLPIGAVGLIASGLLLCPAIVSARVRRPVA